jgi:phage shock protein E
MPPWFPYALAAAILLALFVMRSIGKISGTRAHELVEGGALLLDVRTPGEFASGHLDGALNVPVQELGSRLGELGDKQRAIVVYCRSGARSGRAKRLLSSRGYASVHDLGAMGRW